MHICHKVMSKRGMPILVSTVLLFLAFQSVAEGIRQRIDTKELEVRIHELINIERNKAGLRPLALDKKLCAIARDHSIDMALRNYFSHTSPEGEDFLDRYKKKGFICRVRIGQGVCAGAENIFCNNMYSSVIYSGDRAHYEWNSLEEIAHSTVKGWMKSTGHRENILQPAFRSHGIGISVKDGKVYITENFC